MEYTSRAMIEMYNVRFVTLNVSVSNYAAVRLYRDALGFWCTYRLLLTFKTFRSLQC